MRKVHIVYVADDGVASLSSGVGTIAHHFISAFPEIADRFSSTDVRLRLSVVSIRPHKDAIGVRSDLLTKARRVCESFGGEVYLLHPRIRPQENYFNFAVWEKYNQEVGQILTRVVQRSDFRTIVLSNDTIFAHVTLTCSLPTLIHVWIPHSLSMIHQQSYVDNSQRYIWERRAVDLITKNMRCYVGYISPFAKDNLMRAFNVPLSQMVPFENGFYMPLFDQYMVSDVGSRSFLEKRGIPTDKNILFSFGRADEYKGLDTSLQVIIQFTQMYPYHGVMVASRFSKESIVTSVQKNLKRILGKNAMRVNLFLDYEFDLPKYILRFSGTKFLLNLPSRDFCPLVPFEAELIGNPNLCVVNSDIGCFDGLIKNNEDGFLCRPSVGDALLKLKDIMNMPDGDSLKIVKRGKERVAARFNIVTNYSRGIARILEGVAVP